MTIPTINISSIDAALLVDYIRATNPSPSIEAVCLRIQRSIDALVSNTYSQSSPNMNTQSSAGFDTQPLQVQPSFSTDVSFILFGMS